MEFSIKRANGQLDLSLITLNDIIKKSCIFCHGQNLKNLSPTTNGLRFFLKESIKFSTLRIVQLQRLAPRGRHLMMVRWII
jgi:hypothetical protein